MFSSVQKTCSSLCNWKMDIKYVNYDCSVCMEDPRAIPNAGGRFFIINETQCQCNGCGSIFPKLEKFSSVQVTKD